MSHKRIKVDIAFLVPGMFVAQLDRSWLESPFAAHGFEISGDNEIQLLRKFCKYVYVDVARSSLKKREILDAHAREVKDPFEQPATPQDEDDSSGFADKILGALGRLGIPGVSPASSGSQRGYQNTVSASQEAPNAAEALGHAMAGMTEILGDVRKNRGVNVDKLKNAVGPMVDSILRNPDAMSWARYMRDQSDVDYYLTVTSAVWAVILGRQLGLDKHALGTLAMGGSLLDIGNANIPESIVMSKEAPTADEENILRNHVEYGVKIVRKTPGINDDIVSMIGCHHERHDGSGYPNGLKGEDIPVYGRIAGLVNCYDIMITHKPYAAPKSSYEAICELNSLAGTQFQNSAVQHFVQAVGMFPTGSLVLLNTGEVAIVLEQNSTRRLRPKLMVVSNPKKEPMATGKSLDLAKVPEQLSKRKARWIVKGYEAGAFDIDPKQYLLD